MDNPSSQPLSDSIKPTPSAASNPNVTATGQPLPPTQTPDDYINNPWTIGVKSVKQVFNKARGVAWILIVLSVLSAGSNSVGNSTSETTESTGSASVNFTPELFAVLGVVLLIIVLLILGTVFIDAMGRYAGLRAIKGQATTIKEAARGVRKKFLGYLLLNVLIGIRVLLWTLLFVLPGFYMSVRYSLAGTAYLDEDTKLRPTEAIKRSVDLTQGAWATTLAAGAPLTLVTLGLISQLVTAGTTAKLYMQFAPLTDSNMQKPRAHIISRIIAAIMLGLFVFVAFAGVFLLVAAITAFA